MENYFGPAALWFDSASTSWNTLILLGFILCAMVLTFKTIIVWYKILISLPTQMLILGAAAIRLVYFSATPYPVRAYDWDAHISYILYVAKYLALPDPHSGWETHQPPIYYVILAMWTQLSKFCGLQNYLPLYTTWQLASLMMSLATFIACIWIAQLLYPQPKIRRAKMLFLSILAVFPGIIYQTTRISNDVPFVLLSFIWLGSVISFWQNKTFTNWMILSSLIGIGMLTKNCTLAFIPVSGLCLLLARDVSWKRKISWAIFGGCGVLLVAGWFQLPRALVERNATTFVVANMHDMPDGLRTEHSLAKLLSFDPIQIVIYPFSSSWKSFPRRDFFLEYFFKSAFTGEWIFPDNLWLVTRSMLIPSLAVFGISLYGMIRAVFQINQKNSDMPMLATFWCFLAMQALWVWREPYSNNQDARYFIILVAPVIYFAISAISTFEERTKFWCECLVWLVVINCTLFLLLLSWL